MSSIYEKSFREFECDCPGLRGHDITTLEETGVQIGLTRERVRQIQVEGLKRLKIIAAANDIDVNLFPK